MSLIFLSIAYSKKNYLGETHLCANLCFPWCQHYFQRWRHWETKRSNPRRRWLIFERKELKRILLTYCSLSVGANTEIGHSPKSTLKTGRRCFFVSYNRTWWYPVLTTILDGDPWFGRNPRSVTHTGTGRPRKSQGTCGDNGKILS